MPHLLISNYQGRLLDSIDLAGRRSLTIGRSPRCDLTLDAPSISRRHALLFEHAGGWHVADTGSRNGVDRSSEARAGLPIEPGGWVRIGPAFLWLDGTEGPGEAPPRTTDTALPHSAEGPCLVLLEPGANTLRRYALADRDLVTIGRDAACDLTLSDPGIAPLHCALYAEHRGWYVTDLDSPGGTWAEGGPTRRRRLVDDRIIRTGETRFWIRDAALAALPGGFGAGAATMAPLDAGPDPQGSSRAPSRPGRGHVTMGRRAG